MTLSIVLVRLGFISLAQATAALTCTVCSDLCVAVPPDLAIDRFNAIVSCDLLFFFTHHCRPILFGCADGKTTLIQFSIFSFLGGGGPGMQWGYRMNCEH